MELANLPRHEAKPYLVQGKFDKVASPWEKHNPSTCPKGALVKKNPILIECLFTPGCSSRDSTIAMVHELTDHLGIKARIREITVSTHEVAARINFLGSPSIRINGIDIEPDAEARKAFGLG